MKLPISSILVAPGRQRDLFDAKEMDQLIQSMQKVGQINPITVHRDGSLIAGERRLRAAQHLCWTEIEVHIFEDLDPKGKELVQLEENIRRADLTWQETARAYSKLHIILKSEHPEGWTLQDTCEYSNTPMWHLRACIEVVGYLNNDPAKISACLDLRGAFNVIQRIRQRTVDTEAGKLQQALAETTHTLFADPTIPPPPKPNDGTSSLRDPVLDIIQADFHKWAAEYDGPKFNFIHVDFPYGLNIDKSAQAQSENWEGFEDRPEGYFSLMHAFIKNYEKFGAACSHIMWWFSMTYYEETVKQFRDAKFRVDSFPLIWLKSDMGGIIPDPKRGGRRVYETALLISCGDRFVAHSTPNGHASPQGKKTHLSEKPQPVLRHFFRLFIDESSSVLDPSVGSGNALAVAEEMKAQRVFGLDLDPVAVEMARNSLRRARVYSKLDEVKI